MPEYGPTSAAGAFGELLKKRRLGAGLTQQELARHALSDKSKVSRVERGQAVPSIDFAQRCDQLFGTGTALTTLAETARAEPYLNLPAGPQYFLGRSAALARLDECVRDRPGGVLFIDGPPGVGKTSLALHWAHDVRERGLFDCVVFADLRGFSAGTPAGEGEILEDLLRGLGIEPTRIPAETDRRMALLRGVLDGRRALIVLDNAVDSRQVRPVLPGMRRCTVLVTSRRRLAGLTIQPGATEIPLRPLEQADAVELLGRIVGERVQAEPEAAGRLVELCDLLPLAVRVAAERIAAHPHQSIAELTAELDAEERYLELLTAADDERLGVRTVISWSHRALDDKAARLFRLLGLHPGPRFRAGAAAALARVPVAEVRHLLDDLVQAHLLVQHSAAFYGFHDLIRAYAAQEIAAEQYAEEREAAVGRLVDWYMHGVSRASRALVSDGRDHRLDPGEPPEGVELPEFGGFDDAYRWCTGELANITPIAQLAREYRRYDRAWQIPVELIDFHMQARPWSVWIASHEVAIAAAREGGDERARVLAIVNVAEAHRRLHQLDRAEALYREAVVSKDTLGPTPSLAWGYLGLGNLAHERGRYPEAAEQIEHAVRVFGELAYEFGAATARVHLGRAYRSLDRRDEAMEQGTRALDAYTVWGDTQGMGYALAPLARAARHFREAELALSYADRALAAYREVGDTWGIADALDERARALRMLGREDEARTLWREAAVLVEDVDPDKAEVILACLGED